ncbi:ATP synthase subunit d [Forsythia ovata]|uniref:ATP synthase subunit d n=1 Tax=Forsythia ovata TaxID=205694 RepID=A0ABD1WEH6_9LAMI
MSGAGKKIADVAFIAGKTIDWEGMSKLFVSDEAHKEKGTGSRLVDIYKQAYDEVKIPQYVYNATPQYKPKFDALLVELKEAEQKSLKESERLEKEIANVQELKMKLSKMKTFTKSGADWFFFDGWWATAVLE